MQALWRSAATSAGAASSSSVGLWRAAIASRLEHTLSALPADWRKLGALHIAYRRLSRAAPPRLPPRVALTRFLRVPADYRTLEVWDSSELRSLQELLTAERERVVEQRGVAKEQQRKVLRVDCDLDLKRIDKIDRWLENIYKDARRTW